MYFGVRRADSGGVSGLDPAIGSITTIEGPTVDAQPANRRDVAPVTGLQARRTEGAVPTVFLRTHRSGHWTIVEVEGEADIQFVLRLRQLIGPHDSHVVFALHQVTFMDAAGLGMIVETQHFALMAGGCVRLVAPSSSTRRLLKLTGCEGMFPTFDSLDQALSTPVDPGRGRPPHPLQPACLRAPHLGRR